ncbi:hypothetical protein ACFY93_27250 [Streptomyces sp. NPDC008313]|uniref:hypothetical protein n=1 Tax=Streptomyces sp. NPDC008313 TaxID=3364826 RepID=UPI0036F0D59A
MSGDRSPRRRRSLNRFALATGSVTVLSLVASGCVTVHGEREFLPTATRAEAARALKDFTTAYNKADKAYDRSLDEDRVTGPLADIDGAKLDAGHETSPDGNANHRPLKLTDAHFVIPKKAGWSRWFLADTEANKGAAGSHWLLVFTRADAEDVWQVSYLTVLGSGDVPKFTEDADGWAEPVAADDPGLAVTPRKLGSSYADYLRSGGDTFAPGTHTSQWRALRKKNATRPGLARQYVDEPLNSGDHAPVGLRTTDGGALVFFATRHYEKQTAARGVDLNVTDKNIQALLKGDPKQYLTLEFVSNQAVLDPAGTSSDREVEFLSRVQGLTGAKGG